MKEFLRTHPALYVSVLGAMTTVLVRLSSHFGLPLSDMMAQQLSMIIGAFGLAFVCYLAAHAHGGQIGAAMSGALSAGADAAEAEVEKDVGAGPPGASPPGPT